MPNNLPTSAPATVIVHDLAQAKAAIAVAAELDLSLDLETPYELGEALGVGWANGFLKVCADDELYLPGRFVFHCGASIGLAQAACACGLPAIRLEPEIPLSAQTLQALQNISGTAGTILLMGPPPQPVFRFSPPTDTPNQGALEMILKEWLLPLSSDDKIT